MCHRAKIICSYIRIAFLCKTGIIDWVGGTNTVINIDNCHIYSDLAGTIFVKDPKAKAININLSNCSYNSAYNTTSTELVRENVNLTQNNVYIN